MRSKDSAIKGENGIGEQARGTLQGEIEEFAYCKKREALTKEIGFASMINLKADLVIVEFHEAISMDEAPRNFNTRKVYLIIYSIQPST